MLLTDKHAQRIALLASITRENVLDGLVELAELLVPADKDDLTVPTSRENLASVSVNLLTLIQHASRFTVAQMVLAALREERDAGHPVDFDALMVALSERQDSVSKSLNGLSVPGGLTSCAIHAATVESLIKMQAYLAKLADEEDDGGDGDGDGVSEGAPDISALEKLLGLPAGCLKPVDGEPGKFEARLAAGTVLSGESEIGRMVRDAGVASPYANDESRPSGLDVA